jgi:hypothetical protein
LFGIAIMLFGWGGGFCSASIIKAKIIEISWFHRIFVVVIAVAAKRLFRFHPDSVLAMCHPTFFSKKKWYSHKKKTLRVWAVFGRRGMTIIQTLNPQNMATGQI